MSGTMVEDRRTAVWEGLEEMREALRAFLVRQCPDENEVEDVIQETFLRAARYRCAHRVKSLRPWAMRIALNVLADSRRRGAKPQASLEDELFDPPAPEPPTVADSAFRVGRLWFDGEVASALLLQTLGELREQDRSLLGAYYGGEQKTWSVAFECGIPRHLVKVRLYRARQRLLQVLELRARGGVAWRRQAS